MAQRRYRLMTRLTSASCFAWVLFGVTSALAAVVEPDGLQIPIPEAQSGDLGWDPANRYRVDTVGLQHMLDAWEGAGVINAQDDASATNVVFSPLCGLAGGMILRGGSCRVDFGWYCTSDPPGQEVIHPLVTAADVVKYHDSTMRSLPGTPPPPPNTWADYANNAKGFVPTIQMGKLKPVLASAALADVRSSPEFQACQSQTIGFAFKGASGTICPMSKFSEPSRNQMSTFGTPWISAVVYQSKQSPGTFYIAFEDMPTLPGSFTPTMGEVKTALGYAMSGDSGWESWKNDGDFNDFVYKVDGILCKGGGQPCTATDAAGTPLLGACSLGVTACSTDGSDSGACTQKIEPKPETCNGWDDDCNGTADDGDLCPEGEICDNGQCVGGCSSGEFPCDDGYTCETVGRLEGYCVKQDCYNVECPEGKRCEGGQCVGGCEGMVCPEGTQCLAGVCIDLCANAQCPDTFVCERGACIPNCTCLPCTDPNRSFCDTSVGTPTSGHCIDQACAGIVCEAFKTCVAGQCVGPCDSNPCGSATCTPNSDGTYSCPNGTPGGTTPGGEPLGGGGLSGLGTDGSSLTPEGTTGGGGDALGKDKGCGCRVASSSSRTEAYGLSLLGLAALALRRGMRRGRRG